MNLNKCRKPSRIPYQPQLIVGNSSKIEYSRQYRHNVGLYGQWYLLVDPPYERKVEKIRTIQGKEIEVVVAPDGRVLDMPVTGPFRDRIEYLRRVLPNVADYKFIKRIDLYFPQLQEIAKEKDTLLVYADSDYNEISWYYGINYFIEKE